MQLLTAKEVKTSSIKIDEGRTKRIQGLHEEETRLVRRVNYLKASLGFTTKQMEDNFALFTIEINQKKSSLLSEVSVLESRKAKALEPIDKIKKEADDILSNAHKKETALDTREEYLNIRESHLAERESELVDRLELMQEKKDSLLDQEEWVVNRDKKVKEAEVDLCRSTKNLNTKWSEYHIAITQSNVDIQKREKLFIAWEKSVNELKKSLDEKEGLLEKERIALKDGYKTLARSQQRILGKK